MDFFSNLWNGLAEGGSSAPNAAQGYYDKIPAVGEKYMNPYLDMGKTAGNQYQDAVSSMLSDPTGHVKNIMDTYYESPQYEFQKEQAIRAANNAAAAGGTLGTGAHEYDIAEKIRGLASADMQQYLQNTLGVENTGLQGNQNLMAQGYGASNSLMDLLSGNLRDQGSLAYDAQSRETAGAKNFLDGVLGIDEQNKGGTNAISKLSSFLPFLF